MKRAIPQFWGENQITRTVKKESQNICDMYPWKLLHGTPARVKLQPYIKRNLHKPRATFPTDNCNQTYSLRKQKMVWQNPRDNEDQQSWDHTKVHWE